jgi:Recombination endonuclease VII
VEKLMKVCNKCKQIKPLSDFGNDSGGKKKRSWCRTCDSKASKDRNEIKKNAPPIPTNHTCPICDKTEEQLNENINPTLRKKGRPWVMDHDHDTKKFRGWVCRKCNLGMGNFSDDHNLVLKAAEYLKKAKDALRKN